MPVRNGHTFDENTQHIRNFLTSYAEHCRKNGKKAQNFEDYFKDHKTNLQHKEGNNPLKNGNIEIAFTGRDLSGLDLSGANFSGVNFSGCNFTKTTLNNTNFTSATLSKTIFVECPNTGITFNKADLSEALFYNTNVTTIKFKKTTLQGTIFANGSNPKTNKTLTKQGAICFTRQDIEYLKDYEKSSKGLSEASLPINGFENCEQFSNNYPAAYNILVADVAKEKAKHEKKSTTKSDKKTPPSNKLKKSGDYNKSGIFGPQPKESPDNPEKAETPEQKKKTPLPRTSSQKTAVSFAVEEKAIPDPRKSMTGQERRLITHKSNSYSGNRTPSSVKSRLSASTKKLPVISRTEEKPVLTKEQQQIHDTVLHYHQLATKLAEKTDEMVTKFKTDSEIPNTQKRTQLLQLSETCEELMDQIQKTNSAVLNNEVKTAFNTIYKGLYEDIIQTADKFETERSKAAPTRAGAIEYSDVPDFVKNLSSSSGYGSMPVPSPTTSVAITTNSDSAAAAEQPSNPAMLATHAQSTRQFSPAGSTNPAREVATAEVRKPSTAPARETATAVIKKPAKLAQDAAKGPHDDAVDKIEEAEEVDSHIEEALDLLDNLKTTKAAETEKHFPSSSSSKSSSEGGRTFSSDVLKNAGSRIKKRVEDDNKKSEKLLKKQSSSVVNLEDLMKTDSVVNFDELVAAEQEESLAQTPSAGTAQIEADLVEIENIIKEQTPPTTPKLTRSNTVTEGLQRVPSKNPTTTVRPVSEIGRKPVEAKKEETLVTLIKPKDLRSTENSLNSFASSKDLIKKRHISHRNATPVHTPLSSKVSKTSSHNLKMEKSPAKKKDIFEVIVTRSMLESYAEYCRDKKKIEKPKRLYDYLKKHEKFAHVFANKSKNVRIKFNFTTFNMSNLDLSYIDLSKYNLSGTDFTNTNLQGANLRKTKLIGTNLFESNLKNADLRAANLYNSTLTSAKFNKKTKFALAVVVEATMSDDTRKKLEKKLAVTTPEKLKGLADGSEIDNYLATPKGKEKAQAYFHSVATMAGIIIEEKSEKPKKRKPRKQVEHTHPASPAAQTQTESPVLRRQNTPSQFKQGDKKILGKIFSGIMWEQVAKDNNFSGQDLSYNDFSGSIINPSILNAASVLGCYISESTKGLTEEETKQLAEKGAIVGKARLARLVANEMALTSFVIKYFYNGVSPEKDSVIEKLRTDILNVQYKLQAIAGEHHDVVEEVVKTKARKLLGDIGIGKISDDEASELIKEVEKKNAGSPSPTVNKGTKGRQSAYEADIQELALRRDIRKSDKRSLFQRTESAFLDLDEEAAQDLSSSSTSASSGILDLEGSPQVKKKLSKENNAKRRAEQAEKKKSAQQATETVKNKSSTGLESLDFVNQLALRTARKAAAEAAKVKSDAKAAAEAAAKAITESQVDELTNSLLPKSPSNTPAPEPKSPAQSADAQKKIPRKGILSQILEKSSPSKFFNMTEEEHAALRRHSEKAKRKFKKEHGTTVEEAQKVTPPTDLDDLDAYLEKALEFSRNLDAQTQFAHLGAASAETLVQVDALKQEIDERPAAEQRVSKKRSLFNPKNPDANKKIAPREQSMMFDATLAELLGAEEDISPAAQEPSAPQRTDSALIRDTEGYLAQMQKGQAEPIDPKKLMQEQEVDSFTVQSQSLQKDKGERALRRTKTPTAQQSAEVRNLAQRVKAAKESTPSASPEKKETPEQKRQRIREKYQQSKSSSPAKNPESKPKNGTHQEHLREELEKTRNKFNIPATPAKEKWSTAHTPNEKGVSSQKIGSERSEKLKSSKKARSIKPDLSKKDSKILNDWMSRENSKKDHGQSK